jgi:hypothetical protein
MTKVIKSTSVFDHGSLSGYPGSVLRDLNECFDRRWVFLS